MLSSCKNILMLIAFKDVKIEDQSNEMQDDCKESKILECACLF